MNISKAAVLGAGTMGAGIAAHLANAGIPTLLLDLAPTKLLPDEEKRGLTLDSPQVRNRIVNSLLESARKLKPAPFMLAENAKLITTGNFADDIAKLNDCDLVIEAVVENLEIKHKLFAEVEKHRKPGAVIASNTSGIPIDSIAEPFSDDFKQHFVGIHFFNPPRYMKLVEVIPGTKTSGEIACQDLRLSGPAARQGRRSGKGPAKFYRQPHRHIRHDGDGPRDDRDGLHADRDRSDHRQSDRPRVIRDISHHRPRRPRRARPRQQKSLSRRSR